MYILTKVEGVDVMIFKFNELLESIHSSKSNEKLGPGWVLDRTRGLKPKPNDFKKNFARKIALKIGTFDSKHC
jgi:hypothetical protein